MGEWKCAVCGRSFSNEHGLNVHIARMHGDPESPEARPRRRAKRAAAPEAPLLAAFTSTAEDLDRATRLVEQCCDGLAVVLDSATRLRRAYIERADQVRKLQAQLAALDAQEA